MSECAGQDVMLTESLGEEETQRSGRAQLGMPWTRRGQDKKVLAW